MTLMPHEVVNQAKDAAGNWRPDYRFWAILSSLCVANLVYSFENTIVVTALPYILEDLHSGDNYIWITNIHFLTG